MAASVHFDSRCNDALPVCLGRENPNRLVSLWDIVRQFSGSELCGALDSLNKLQLTWMMGGLRGGDSSFVRFFDRDPALTTEERNAAAERMQGVEAFFRQAGLNISAEAVVEFHQELLTPSLRVAATVVISRIDEVIRTMRRELQSAVFLYVPKENSRWYESPLVGWEETTGRWPKLRLDLEESSKCFALDRFAGAIFHALLVAEFGVIQVAELMGEAGDRPGWGCLERLERIRQKPYKQRTPLQQNHSKFLDDTLPLMLAVKDSWRHKIYHVDNKLVWLDTDFSPRITAEIISATQGLMRRLALDLPPVP